MRGELSLRVRLRLILMIEREDGVGVSVADSNPEAQAFPGSEQRAILRVLAIVVRNITRPGAFERGATRRRSAEPPSRISYPTRAPRRAVAQTSSGWGPIFGIALKSNSLSFSLFSRKTSVTRSALTGSESSTPTS